jgi:hypothetical protein
MLCESVACRVCLAAAAATGSAYYCETCLCTLLATNVSAAAAAAAAAAIAASAIAADWCRIAQCCAKALHVDEAATSLLRAPLTTAHDFCLHCDCFLHSVGASTALVHSAPLVTVTAAACDTST